MSSRYKIIRNSAICKLCDTEIVSRYRHDFVSCDCGEIFVDGGTSYIRRGGRNLENIIDTSEYEDLTDEDG
jgi:ribosomal protein L37AE/L43A